LCCRVTGAAKAVGSILRNITGHGGPRVSSNLMSMNPWQTEQARLSLLRYLNEAAPYGLGEPLLLQCLRCEGWIEQDRELVRELGYLRDKGLVEPALKLISPENPTWRITAAGRDFLARSAPIS
jgi:hypothetical protein